jgi:hypothetical protein
MQVDEISYFSLFFSFARFGIAYEDYTDDGEIVAHPPCY